MVGPGCGGRARHLDRQTDHKLHLQILRCDGRASCIRAIGIKIVAAPRCSPLYMGESPGCLCAVPASAPGSPQILGPPSFELRLSPRGPRILADSTRSAELI